MATQSSGILSVKPADHMHIARAYAAMSTRYAQLANCSTCSAEIRQGALDSANYFKAMLEELEKANDGL